ncbi:hypothetical protein D9611_008071 [Ephemerocybe angulata]|uniref:Uncharacterized protein n=1 Tax=Ephemerocybe angulata TaxID=980116 RepID=A0A8H5FCT9_9AGAR|nr:hypothetical protein D9611_008071 [Tulosesus angulatus]
MGAAGTGRVNTTERLAALPKLMESGCRCGRRSERRFTEYLAHCDERRAFISGFNGSAGCAIVTLKDAYLFTDSRYFLQAGQQLDDNWELMKQGQPDVPTWQDFLHKNIRRMPRTSRRTPHRLCAVPLEKNLVDEVWAGDRPAKPHNPVFYLDEKYSGRSFQDKVSSPREEIKKENGKALVVVMLDEVAWLFNLGGSDIDFNPVFFACAVVTPQRAVLFIFGYLKSLAHELHLESTAEAPKVLVSSKASLAIIEVITPKGSEKETDLEGFRQSHIRDGVALARYFAWLEEALNEGKDVNEGLSFTTISSTGPNGAIIHYSPDIKNCDTIKKGQIYLCGSGAQFLDGTTDVTRTWHFGTPTPEEIRAFTRVLQGHTSIDTALLDSSLPRSREGHSGKTVLVRQS